MPHPIRYMICQVAIGILLGTVLLAAIVALAGETGAALLAEAVRHPLQFTAIWAGAVAPFAVGFLATGLGAEE